MTQKIAFFPIRNMSKPEMQPKSIIKIVLPAIFWKCTTYKRETIKRPCFSGSEIHYVYI